MSKRLVDLTVLIAYSFLGIGTISTLSVSSRKRKGRKCRFLLCPQ